jgi:hypothetical protein
MRRVLPFLVLMLLMAPMGTAQAAYTDHAPSDEYVEIGTKSAGAFPTDILSQDGNSIQYDEDCPGGRNCDLRVQFNWSGIPIGTSYDLNFYGYNVDPTPPTAEVIMLNIWNSVTSAWDAVRPVPLLVPGWINVSLTEAYYNAGSPMIEVVDATPDLEQNNLLIDYLNVRQNYTGGGGAVMPIDASLEYEYDLFSNVRVWLDVNESYPLMDHYEWHTEDGRSWTTFEPNLSFSEPWSVTADIPLYVTVRSLEGVERELSTTVHIDHSWFFILILALILCILVAYLLASRHKVIMRRLKKEVKL